MLREYLSLIPMNGLSVELALRKLLLRFKLPGEAQKIDRMMHAFAQSYHQSNPQRFMGPDTVYILSFSIILLNTDLHNPNNPRRMSKESFAANCHAIDDNLSVELLFQIYDDIAESELCTESEGVFDYALSAPDIEGVLWKRGDRFHNWNRRWCVVANRCLYYFYSKRDKSPRGVIPLEDLTIRPLDRKGRYRFEITADDSLQDGPWVGGSYLGNEGLISSISSIEQTRNESYRSYSSVQSLLNPSKTMSPSPPLLPPPPLPVVKSAKYVKGQLVEGRRDRYVFQCSSREERDQWIQILGRRMLHRPSVHLTSSNELQLPSTEMQ